MIVLSITTFFPIDLVCEYHCPGGKKHIGILVVIPNYNEQLMIGIFGAAILAIPFFSSWFLEQ